MAIVNGTAIQKGRSLVIRGGGVITMDPELGDLLTGDVHIRDGIIVEIGKDLQVADAEVIDARNMIVMPGFIDAHRHLWEGTIRNSLPIEDLNEYFMMVNMGWGKVYAPEDAYIGTLVAALGALDSGVTTLFDWSHIQNTPDHTSATIAALRESGMRTVFAYGPPCADQDDTKSAWPHDLLRLRRDEFASDDSLLTLALAAYSPEHCPYEMAKSFVDLARQAGVIVSLHVGLNGMGEPDQILRFGREGLLGPDVNLIHCNTTSVAEWEIIAKTGTSISITPTTEMQMGQGVPPIQAARNVGVKPGIGVDVETSGPNDMWTQMRALFGLQRMNSFELQFSGREAPSRMNMQDILECATISGAVCGQVQHKTGSLTPGKQADIILLRADMLNVMPVNDLKTAVVLNMGPHNVDTVMVAGRIVKRGGVMLGVDMASLSSRLYDSRDRIYEKSGFPLNSPIRRYQSSEP